LLAEPTPAARPEPAIATTSEDSALLTAAKAAAAYSALCAGEGTLVMYKGEIVYQQYENGYSASKPHVLASGTKSFTGVLAAAAIQDGLIKSWDEVVSDTITEWKSDPRKAKITVRQLLDLSSGLAPSIPTLAPRGGAGGAGGARGLGGAQLSPEERREALRKLLDARAKQNANQGEGEATGLDGESAVELITLGRRGVDTYAEAVKAPAVGEPGAKFAYGPVHYFAFGEFLSRKLKASDLPQKTYADYLQVRYFDALGLSTQAFANDKVANPDLPGGAAMTAPEWARFGEFLRNHGTVKPTSPEAEPKQVINWEILAECFKPSKANKNYGLTFWLLTDDREAQTQADTGGRRSADALSASDAQLGRLKGPDGKPLEVWMAAGLGKQRLYIVPQYELVAVRFGSMAQRRDRSNGQRGNAEANGRQHEFENADFLGPLIKAIDAANHKGR